MSGECTWCAFFGFIVLPLASLVLAVLPLSLIVRLRNVRLGVRLRWLACAGSLLLLAAAVAVRYSTLLAWVATALLYLASLAVAVTFRTRHKYGVVQSWTRSG